MLAATIACWNSSKTDKSEAPGDPGVPSDFIADHIVAKESVLRRIPQSAIAAARNNLHILYCGTSHSQQVMEGMAGLVQYKTDDGTRYAFSYDGNPNPGKLDIHYRGAPGTDLSNDTVDGNGHTGYFNGTVAYLDDPAHADVNVVMWSWCYIGGHDVQIYLDNFDELISMYGPGGTKIQSGVRTVPVTFVFMTGHAWGTEGDNPNAWRSPYVNAQLIREHCEQNGYFCLDYWSQDVYEYGTDSYKPTENGNANYQHYLYCQTHTKGVDWFECRDWVPPNSVRYPAHTDEGSPPYPQHLTGNRRAYAAWWLWARIAGWDGTLD